MGRSIVALVLALTYIAIFAEARANFVEKFRQFIKDTDTSEEKTETEESFPWYSSLDDEDSESWSSYLSLDDDCDKNCGIRNEELITRIVNGEDAERGAWPWQAMLYKNRGFTCGGTYIGGRFIVTAAHCFGRTRNPKDWKVNLGKTNFGLGTNEENGDFGSKVSEIIIHEDYDNSTIDNDIALMVLKKEVPRDATYINMACLDDDQVFDKKSECFITGWGVTSEDGGHPEKLQEAKVQLFDRRTCINKSSYTSDDITVNMLCAGYIEGGIDTCQGDSGGPLVCNSPDACGNDRWYLVGVTSWGNGCAKDGYPGVYTKVANYIDWINQQINSIK